MARTQRSVTPPAAAYATFERSARNLIASTRDTAVARAKSARKAAVAGATEARNRTLGAVSRLEKVFEQRVSQAVAKLGVPTARDVRALTRQVEKLEASVQKLSRSRAAAPRARSRSRG